MDSQLIFDNFMSMTTIKNLIIVLILLKLYSVYRNLKITELINVCDSDQNDSYFRKSENSPPNYPNGWLPVMASIELKKNQVKPLFRLGNDLVLFRGSSGKVHVFDAHCPHLGANLGYGGSVENDTIRCPFHGWKFNDNGYCIESPGCDSKLPKVQIKVWKSIEIYGFIFVWNSSESDEPTWSFDSTQIEDKFIYRGKIDNTFNCHIQEIPENVADLMHLNELHKASELITDGQNEKWYYKYLLKYMYYKMECQFSVESEVDSHISQSVILIDYFLFGFNIFKVKSIIKLKGPALFDATIHIDWFGKSTYRMIQCLITIGPNRQRQVTHFYSERGFRSLLMGKNLVVVTGNQLVRDVLVWNNKKYLANPILNKSERQINKFRLWYKQFYPLATHSLKQIDFAIKDD